MKDQKRSHLLWIWDIVLLSKERNSDKNLKNNKKKISEKKKKKISGLTGQLLHSRLQCLSKGNLLVQTVGSRVKMAGVVKVAAEY